MPYTHLSIFQEGEGSKDFKLLLLDWENVGIGSGPQEIGQYLISHMDPSLRAQVEREVVEDLDLEGFFWRLKFAVRVLKSKQSMKISKDIQSLTC